MTNLKWVNSKHQLQYRIGDAILYRDYKWSCDARDRILGSPATFSQSIAYQYLEKIDPNQSRVDVKVLREVVKRYIMLNEIELPGADEVVVHLRLGDAKATLGSVTEIADSLRRCLAFWKSLPKQVTLVSAFHIGRSILLSESKLSHEQSYRQQTHFANGLRQALSLSLDLPCKIRSSNEPDSDFSYLASAKYLVLGSGGFSLAASLASEGSVCVPHWCLFNNGQRGNFMRIEDYYELMSPRVPHTLHAHGQGSKIN